jgi:hypothetical protein
MRLAQDYGRSLLPPDLVFPRPEIWEVPRDGDVKYSAWFTGPFPGWVPGTIPANTPPPVSFGSARLSRRERVWIETADNPKPPSVFFKPLRSAELQESIVPDDLRKASDDSHFTLKLRTAHTRCGWPREPTYFCEAFRPTADGV